MHAAEYLIAIMTAYALLGVLFASAFVTFGIQMIDPLAKGAGAGFRLIIFPGVAALWPLLLKRWISERKTT